MPYIYLHIYIYTYPHVSPTLMIIDLQLYIHIYTLPYIYVIRATMTDLAILGYTIFRQTHIGQPRQLSSC